MCGFYLNDPQVRDLRTNTHRSFDSTGLSTIAAFSGPLISSSGGIRIANRILPAEPTLSDMDSTDIGFKLLIENTLRDIKSPEHRHLVIETITIIATGMSRTI